MVKNLLIQALAAKSDYQINILNTCASLSLLEDNDKLSDQGSDLPILILSVAHKIKAKSSRLAALINTTRNLIRSAIYEILIGRDSPIFNLYGLQWFV